MWLLFEFYLSTDIDNISIPKRIVGLRAFRGGTLEKVSHKALNIVVVPEIDKRVVAMAFLH